MADDSIKTRRSLLALSLQYAESAGSALSYNTYMAADATLLVAADSIINLEIDRQSNRGDAGGREEPDEWYAHGVTRSVFPFNFPKPQPQHYGFVFGYALGSAAAPANLVGTDLYEHVFNPTADDDLASFTAYQRYGGGLRPKRRFAGLKIGNFRFRVAKGDRFPQLSGEAIGSGKFSSNVLREELTGNLDDTTLDLTYAVQDNDVDGVHGLWLDRDGDGKFETQITISSLTNEPGTYRRLNFTAPSTSTAACTFQVVYIPTESSYASWTTAFAEARVEEPPLKVVECRILRNVDWDGSIDTFGYSPGCDIESLEWTFNNNLEAPAKCPGSNVVGLYADELERGDREQSVVLSGRAAKWVNQAEVEDQDGDPSTYTLMIKMESTKSASFGRKWRVYIVFPLLALVSAPLSDNGGKLNETATFDVGEHATYGSVETVVRNLWSGGYAQLAA